MESCIYEGSVRHRRFKPVANTFRYSLCMLYLDLAELPGVFDSHPLFSVSRPNVAYLKRLDHLGDPALPLDECVRELVRERAGTRPTGPIRLLTHLRYFGHCFNPVSFYYCYDDQGLRPETIVAEVHNTPWGERHCYVLGDQSNEGRGRWRRHRFRKAFHVSPFMDMDLDYDWRFLEPGPRLQVHMENARDGRKLFDVTLSLRRRPIGRAALTRVLVRYPLMTLKVVGAIHWQALKLWRKGAPFYTHPAKRQGNEA